MKKQEEEEFLQGYQGVNISKQQTAAVAAPEPEPAVTTTAETVPAMASATETVPESEEPTTEIVAESEEPTDMELSEEVPEEELNEAIRDAFSNTHYVQADINKSFSEEDLDELDKYGRKKLPTGPVQNPSPLPTTEDSDPEVFTDIPGTSSAPSSSEPALDPSSLPPAR